MVKIPSNLLKEIAIDMMVGVVLAFAAIGIMESL